MPAWLLPLILPFLRSLAALSLRPLGFNLLNPDLNYHLTTQLISHQKAWKAPTNTIKTKSETRFQLQVMEITTSLCSPISAVVAVSIYYPLFHWSPIGNHCLSSDLLNYCVGSSSLHDAWRPKCSPSKVLHKNFVRRRIQSSYSLAGSSWVWHFSIRRNRQPFYLETKSKRNTHMKGVSSIILSLHKAQSFEARYRGLPEKVWKTPSICFQHYI